MNQLFLRTNFDQCFSRIRSGSRSRESRWSKSFSWSLSLSTNGQTVKSCIPACGTLVAHSYSVSRDLRCRYSSIYTVITKLSYGKFNLRLR